MSDPEFDAATERVLSKAREAGRRRSRRHLVQFAWIAPLGIAISLGLAFLDDRYEWVSTAAIVGLGIGVLVMAWIAAKTED